MNLVILANLIHVNLVNSCKFSDSGNSVILVNFMFLNHLVFLVNLYSDSLESSDSGEWGVSG